MWSRPNNFLITIMNNGWFSLSLIYCFFGFSNLPSELRCCSWRFCNYNKTKLNQIVFVYQKKKKKVKKNSKRIESQDWIISELKSWILSPIDRPNSSWRARQLERERRMRTLKIIIRIGIADPYHDLQNDVHAVIVRLFFDFSRLQQQRAIIESESEHNKKL